MASTIKTNNITGFSGGAGSAPITLSGDTATLGSGVVMASSGVTVRNISQVALASDQSLTNSTTETTFFSPTYTPLFSGSKVQGTLTARMMGYRSGTLNARKRLRFKYTGTGITDLDTMDDVTFGIYDYGGNGGILEMYMCVGGHLLTTTSTATITCNLTLKNSAASTSEGWEVFGNNTLEETFFTWIEYR